MTKLILKYKTTSKKDVVCSKCRNANQETLDMEDGLVFCKFGNEIKSEDYSCNITVEGYLMFEEYNGVNCTWSLEDDFEVEFSKE